MERERRRTDHVQLLTSVVNGHITALSDVIAIGKELTHEVFQGDTPLLKNAGFSVLGKDYIFRE